MQFSQISSICLMAFAAIATAIPAAMPTPIISAAASSATSTLPMSSPIGSHAAAPQFKQFLPTCWAKDLSTCKSHFGVYCDVNGVVHSTAPAGSPCAVADSTSNGSCYCQPFCDVEDANGQIVRCD